MIQPVTAQSIAEARASAQRERDEIEAATGIRITDDPLNPLRVLATRRISVYRQIQKESDR